MSLTDSSTSQTRDYISARWPFLILDSPSISSSSSISSSFSSISSFSVLSSLLFPLRSPRRRFQKGGERGQRRVTPAHGPLHRHQCVRPCSGHPRKALPASPQDSARPREWWWRRRRRRRRRRGHGRRLWGWRSCWRRRRRQHCVCCGSGGCGGSCGPGVIGVHTRVPLRARGPRAGLRRLPRRGCYLTRRHSCPRPGNALRRPPLAVHSAHPTLRRHDPRRASCVLSFPACALIDALRFVSFRFASWRFASFCLSSFPVFFHPDLISHSHTAIVHSA